MIVKTAHVEMVDGTEDLIVEVVFEIPGLGDYPVSFMGSNVRTLHHALGEVIERYPALCGKVQPTGRTESVTIPGYDPGKANSN